MFSTSSRSNANTAALGTTIIGVELSVLLSIASFTNPSVDSCCCSFSFNKRLERLPFLVRVVPAWGENELIRRDPEGVSNGVICGVILSVDDLLLLTLFNSSSLSGSDKLFSTSFGT